MFRPSVPILLAANQRPARYATILHGAICAVLNNPLGHNAPSVWQIRHAGYVGNHPAAFPTELVRRIIVTACDTNSLVLDPFGGSGTTALVALQHGHRAITIDSHRPFTDEARERCPMRRLIAKLRTHHNRWNWQPIDMMPRVWRPRRWSVSSRLTDRQTRDGHRCRPLRRSWELSPIGYAWTTDQSGIMLIEVRVACRQLYRAGVDGGRTNFSAGACWLAVSPS